MILDDIRELLTPAQFDAFLACYAGNDFRFEKAGDGRSFVELARVVGAEAADRLRRRFAGERVYIPRNLGAERQRRDAEIMARISAGDSHVAIARTYRITERQVRQIRAENGQGRPAGRPAKERQSA